jgi:hypothetical protein
MAIQEEIGLLDKERDKEKINALRLEAMRIELMADKFIEPIQATLV